MKRLYSLWALILFFMAACTPTPKYIVGLKLLQDSQNWPQSCEKLKVEYLNTPLHYLKFVDKPVVQFTEPLWSIELQETRLPIPQATYKKFIVTRDKDTLRSFFLADGESPGENRFFVVAGLGKEFAQDHPEFSVAPSGFEARRKQFTVTPDDLTCSNWKDEFPVALDLYLKGPAPALKGSTTDHVYGDLGELRGWLLEMSSEESIFWQVEVAHPTDPSRYMFALLQVPRVSGYHDLGLLIGTDFTRGVSSLPGWLVALNTALKTDNLTDWKHFLDTAFAAGFDEERLKESARNLGVTDFPSLP